jgi:PAS domain S-box-containing protein
MKEVMKAVITATIHSSSTGKQDGAPPLSPPKTSSRLRPARRRFSESERHFRDMADAAPVFIWMSGPDKRCIYLNKSWLAYTGKSFEDELGSGWIDDVHPDDVEQCLQVYTTAFDARVPFSMEYRLRRFDGTYHWMTDNGVPRFSNKGEFLGYIGSCNDIDEARRGKELQRMNTLLKKQRAQLVAINNAKDEFISIASHQLRTPASAVKQYIGLLMEGYVGDLSDMQLKMIHAAFESNQRQLSVIDDLLRVAQVDAGKITLLRRTCDLVQLLDDVVEEQRTKYAAQDQHITYKHPEQPIIASVDQRLLRMVIENLVDNASKYSGQGKTVEITLRQTKRTITLRIKDHGVGISPKDQKRLFQKFSRVANPLTSLVSGSGLGLYWAKKIVVLHGGSIKVTSHEGRGSTFALSLPLP